MLVVRDNRLTCLTIFDPLGCLNDARLSPDFPKHQERRRACLEKYSMQRQTGGCVFPRFGGSRCGHALHQSFFKPLLETLKKETIRAFAMPYEADCPIVLLYTHCDHCMHDLAGHPANNDGYTAATISHIKCGSPPFIPLLTSVSIPCSTTHILIVA